MLYASFGGSVGEEGNPVPFKCDTLYLEKSFSFTVYDVKIKASQLLMDNTENTFVTPVFNGSASLRSAAGEMIESVTKSMRRKQTVDEKYMENLFKDTTSLYRLDQIQTDSTGKQSLGPLPIESVFLLSALAVIWVCIGSYVIFEAIKKKKLAENQE